MQKSSKTLVLLSVAALLLPVARLCSRINKALNSGKNSRKEALSIRSAWCVIKILN